MNKKFIIKDEDKIIRFNSGLLLELFNGKTTDFLFRTSKSNFQGVRKNYIIQNKFILYIRNKINFGIVGFSNFFKNKSKKIKYLEYANRIIIKTKIPILNSLKKLTGKPPSSGLVALIYYLNKYPKAEIYLMAFTFHKYDDINHYWHNFELESSFVNYLISKSKRIFILR